MNHCFSDNDKTHKPNLLSTKKLKKLCIACNKKSSFDFVCKTKTCSYPVCVNCTLSFAKTVNGHTFDKLRIKCMICREPLPSEQNVTALRQILKRRQNFFTTIDDSVTDEKIFLCKKNGNIYIGRIDSVFNLKSNKVYNISLPPPLLTLAPRTLPTVDLFVNVPLLPRPYTPTRQNQDT